MSPDLAALLACSLLAAWLAYRIHTDRRIPMPDLPADGEEPQP
jgi:hypothetical protein